MTGELLESTEVYIFICLNALLVKVTEKIQNNHILNQLNFFFKIYSKKYNMLSSGAKVYPEEQAPCHLYGQAHCHSYKNICTLHMWHLGVPN